MRKYMQMWGNFESLEEQLFAFSDHSPVKPQNVWSVLKLMLQKLGLPKNILECTP